MLGCDTTDIFPIHTLTMSFHEGCDDEADLAPVALDEGLAVALTLLAGFALEAGFFAMAAFLVDLGLVVGDEGAEAGSSAGDMAGRGLDMLGLEKARTKASRDGEKGMRSALGHAF